MPLYDFQCQECGTPSTLLLKFGAPAVCPRCGSGAMAKQFAPCSFTGFAAAPARSAAAAASASPAHAHGPACGCGPATKEPAPCATEAKADQLIKKYLG